MAGVNYIAKLLITSSFFLQIISTNEEGMNYTGDGSSLKVGRPG